LRWSGCSAVDVGGLTHQKEWIIRQRQPLAVYFPETIESELDRYPRIPELRDLMEQAGFGEANEELVEFSWTIFLLSMYIMRVIMPMSS